MKTEMFKSLVQAEDWELNKLAAEEIMDWHTGQRVDQGYMDQNNNFQSEIASWCPIGDVKEAFMVLDKMTEQGWSPSLDFDNEDGGWLCVLCRKNLDAPNMIAIDIARAITFTCLIAKLCY